MRGLIYLGYFLLKSDYRDVAKSLRCAVKRGYGRTWLLYDMLVSAIRYGSSFSDYFNFRFFEKDHESRNGYVTMGYLYEFHKKLNAPSRFQEIDDKVQFSKNFAKFRQNSYLYDANQLDEAIKFFSGEMGSKIVFKDPNSAEGKGVRIVKVESGKSGPVINGVALPDFLRNTLAKCGAIYAEPYFIQHPQVSELAPTAVNTIRVITVVNRDQSVAIVGSVLRISVDCEVDNYAAQNLAADVDSETGVVLTGGIRRRAACDEFKERHPVTGVPIKGFQIPHWDAVVAMVKEAALVVPSVRSVGWDVAIGPDAPVLIEGNSKWNKGAWQIPAGQGKKHLIAHYLDGLQVKQI